MLKIINNFTNNIFLFTKTLIPCYLLLSKIGIKKASNDFHSRLLKIRCWHRVIFPGGGPPSIFTEMSLYDRVRDGNGWFPHS